MKQEEIKSAINSVLDGKDGESNSELALKIYNAINQFVPSVEPKEMTDFFEPKENKEEWIHIFRQISQILFKGGKARNVVEFLYKHTNLSPASSDKKEVDWDEVFSKYWCSPTRENTGVIGDFKNWLKQNYSLPLAETAENKREAVEFETWIKNNKYFKIKKTQTGREYQSRNTGFKYNRAELYTLFLTQVKERGEKL